MARVEIPTKQLEECVRDASDWRTVTKQETVSFRENRRTCLGGGRVRRKTVAANS